MPVCDGLRSERQKPVPERLVVEIWKRQLVNAGSLATASGVKVRVVDPGRESRERGPDLTEAVVALGGSVPTCGDIEVHRSARDWRGHGHHRDPEYNRVILHVVWEGDAGAMLESGSVVPTVSLRSCLSGSLEEVVDWVNSPMPRNEPCFRAGKRLGHAELCAVLDEAGEVRFRLKASNISEALHTETPSQLLYQGMMGALGYAKNKEPFEEIARRLRIEALESVCRGRSRRERVAVVEALLLGVGGFQSGGDGHWDRICSQIGQREVISPSCWRLFRVRPENHPARRLSGAAHLLSGFMEGGGFLEAVLKLLHESESDLRCLEESFTVRATEGVSEHKRTLIGQGRAREIVVNVVLPFAFAWATAEGQPGLMERVQAIHRSYPCAGEYGITRELTDLILDPDARRCISTARRQQGLIHLAKSYCHQRRCASCPLSRRLQAVRMAC